MRKLLLAASLLAVIVSCNQKKKDYAILSGTIENQSGEKVTLYNTKREEIKKINISPEGTFRDTIENAEGNYVLVSGNKYAAPVYLAGGYDINISADATNFEETLTYTGEGKEANEYTKEKFKKENEFRMKSREIFGKEETEFLKEIDSYNEELSKELEKVNDKDFIAKEKKNIRYTAIAQKKSYEGLHQQITNNPEFRVSDSYPDVMKDVTLDNEEDFNESDAYKQLVMMDFFSKVQKEVNDNSEIPQVFLNKAEKLKEGIIRDEILLAGLRFFQNVYSLTDLEKIHSLLTDKEEKEKIKERIDSMQALVPGSPSPKFENLENYDGSTTSLDDFKGKFVYIDVWATWCGPCRQEIPHLKNLEKEYHKNKDLVFVSISTDQPAQKEAWKNMIKDLEMGGVQLIETADNNQFTQGYNITSIPRFILIDKEGKIISPNAPRPSDKEGLTALFEKNGIKK